MWTLVPAGNLGGTALLGEGFDSDLSLTCLGTMSQETMSHGGSHGHVSHILCSGAHRMTKL